jgi:hypothetical protein
VPKPAENNQPHQPQQQDSVAARGDEGGWAEIDNLSQSDIAVANQSQRQMQVARAADGKLLPGSHVSPATEWQPGQSANPGGIAAGTAFPGKWYGALADKTDEELRAVMDDQRASMSKRAAARIIFEAFRGEASDAAGMRARRELLAEVMDRTDGRAIARLDARVSARAEDVDSLLASARAACQIGAAREGD